MITEENFTTLVSDAFSCSVKDNINRDPLSVALDKKTPNASMVASQIKRLKKAEKKLPSYFNAQALLTEKAYEQASSEACAELKHMSGDTLLDLTCGLGVDSFVMSRRFKRVVAIERDPMTYKIAVENFKRLGCSNVELVMSSAEDYLASCKEHFDWCLVDPDRRDASNRRKVLLEDCSPDVLKLKTRLKDIADSICIKCSPLFDTDECFRLFPGCDVEVVSQGGECREVDIYLGKGTSGSISAATAGLGRFVLSKRTTQETLSCIPASFDTYKYLTIPDPSVRHARLCRSMFEGKADIWSEDGVALSTTPPCDILGRTFRICSVLEYKPKIMRKLLNGKRIEIIRRGITDSNSAIAKALGVREGGEERWCFTRIGARTWAFNICEVCD